MKLNWKDIDKDTILYLLIPFKDELGNIYYEYQESKVIFNKPYLSHKGNLIYLNIRFKYTNQNGNRKRVTLKVQNINQAIQEYPNNDNKFGNIFISLENQKSLQDKYLQIISEEINNLNNKIIKYKEQIKFLEKQTYNELLKSIS